MHRLVLGARVWLHVGYQERAMTSDKPLNLFQDNWMYTQELHADFTPLTHGSIAGALYLHSTHSFNMAEMMHICTCMLSSNQVELHKWSFVSLMYHIVTLEKYQTIRAGIPIPLTRPNSLQFVGPIDPRPLRFRRRLYFVFSAEYNTKQGVRIESMVRHLTSFAHGSPHSSAAAVANAGKLN